MESIKTKTDLHNAILHLEEKQLLEKEAMVKHYYETYENLKPVNLLKNTITEITEADDLKKNMLKAAIALAIGYITKKIVEKFILRTRTPMTNAIETILQIVVSGWVAKNGDILKNIVLFLMKTVLQQGQKYLPSSEREQQEL